MSRFYAQIEGTLPHSQKIRQLTSDQKWAYLCAHLSLLGNYIGLFRYPRSVWAYDADLDAADLDNAIQSMRELGLIEYDDNEGFVRLIGWSLKKNAPQNASSMASRVKDFATTGASDWMILPSAGELVVGSIKRAQSWNPDSVEWPKLREVFKPFLATMRQNFEDDFHAALEGCLIGQNRAVKAELCGLMPSLQFYLEAPCPHPVPTVGAHETRRDEDNTHTKKDLDKIGRSDFQISDDAPEGPRWNAEKVSKKEGPRPETVASLQRMGTRW